jgi:hypothetical protein
MTVDSSASYGAKGLRLPLVLGRRFTSATSHSLHGRDGRRVAILALCGVALGAIPMNGRYSGETDQGKAVGFTVASGGTKVQHFKFSFHAACSSGATIDRTQTFSGTWQIRAGRFGVSGASSTVSGKITSSGKASGTLRIDENISLPGELGPGAMDECDTGTVHWSARIR